MRYNNASNYLAAFTIADEKPKSLHLEVHLKKANITISSGENGIDPLLVWYEEALSELLSAITRNRQAASSENALRLNKLTASEHRQLDACSNSAKSVQGQAKCIIDLVKPQEVGSKQDKAQPERSVKT